MNGAHHGLHPLLGALAGEIRRIVREELDAARRDVVWIDQTASPIGRRAHLKLARSGMIEASKVGRRVLIRADDLHDYITSHRLTSNHSDHGGDGASDGDAEIRDDFARAAGRRRKRM